VPHFAANLSLMYTEYPFLDRFAAAAADGFDAVEYLFPYTFEASQLAERLQAHGLKQVLFNAPAGDWDAGERGMACLVGRDEEFHRSVERALQYAVTLGCPRVHVMLGVPPSGADRAEARSTGVARLAWAAEQAAAVGVVVLMEPLNPRDMPGYLLSRQDQAHEIVQEVGAPNLKVQMDLYHCQIVEGDLATKIREYLPTGRVGHFQVAGVPERHEPDRGEVRYRHLFELLDELGYDGYVGCEYHPESTQPGGTTAGLGWLRRWKESRG
jgi:hydroxypyruvate isomerase